MLYKDGRFSKDPRFIYFATNTLLRNQALAKGRIYVQRNSEFENMNGEQIKAALLANPALYKKILSYCSNLRSTPPYWYSKSKELEDMVKQLKSPTLFFTLSAADLQWPELFRLLGLFNLDDNEPLANESREYRRRKKLLNENPLLVAWFFEIRSESFIKNVLFRKFRVKDFWYRIEFQHRGSPHIHGFVWLEDAPPVDNLENMNDSEIANIIHYFDALISASNYSINPHLNNQLAVNANTNPCKLNYSDVDTNEVYQHLIHRVDKHLADYSKLINIVQRHTRCTSSCLKKLRNSNTLVCRYKYPKQLNEETRITRNEHGKFEISFKRNDPRMNNHNPFVSIHWRANTDFQPIISLDSVIHYISKYASKCETSSNLLNNVVNSIGGLNTTNRNATSFIQSIFCTQCGLRDYSAQECIWILMGFSFYKSSRKFVVLNFSNNAFIPAAGEIEDSVSRNPEQEYGNRLLNFQIAGRRGRRGPNYGEEHQQRLENERAAAAEMSMFNFFSTYYKSNGDDGAIWSKYNKKPILRIFPKISRADNEEAFCKQEVKLHVPWTDNVEKLNPNNLSWRDVYIQNSHLIPNSINLENQDSEDEFEEEAPEDRAEMDLEEWMIYLRERPDSEQAQAGLGLREQDNINWSATFNNYNNIEEYINFINTLRENDLQQNYPFPNVQLSIEQQQVVNLIRAQIHYLRTGVEIAEFRQSIIIQGKAGSGKSTLIQAITSVLNEELGSSSFIVLAPTGAAASNINGKTIHNGLRINIDNKLRSLNQVALNEIQQEFLNCNFIIIDEMSLIGCTLLRKVDIRLREIKSNDLPFGGLFLILLGDLKQLPPVKDRAFYGDGFNNEYSGIGQVLYKNIQSAIILPNSHRQSPEQQVFRDLLDRISNGETTVTDWQLINSRALDKLSEAERLLFNNSLRLFDTSKEAIEYNELKLREFSSVYRLRSINNCELAERTRAKDSENLQQVLYLAVGKCDFLNLYI